MRGFFLSALYVSLLICSVGIVGCTKKTDQTTNPDFTMLSSAKTGLHFNNNLQPNVELNIFDYMYFYNGGGVALADFNKDGYLDLYFTGNEQSNALYLNQKNLTFKDVTQISKATGEGGWSTGVTVTDINNDGWLDIYVSQVGDYRKLQGHNRLYIWKSLTKEGVPVYEESSAAYGLDLVGFGTQAGFFDFDNDGDLDLFQVNHSVHLNGTFGRRKDFEGTFHDRAGDRLFRNDDGKFVDVTASAGILSTAIGYGLGLAFSDINNDGWTDIYVTNDFHENDYLYINQQNGTFKESINDEMRHTSRYAMGVDIGDINNDGYNEIFTLDMRPEDPYILKSSLGEDDYGEFQFKLSFGYNYQYARNTLQLNNRNNTFSEIGVYANVFASDWSWATLFLDFDDDGYKDIYISNGIPKRMNDIDYVNYISNNEIHWKINMDQMKDSDLIVEQKLPSIKLKNKFFKNNHNL
ncbi:MAG: VCBS repeat-containing protein, partial [Saprospiraceae bacterium]